MTISKIFDALGAVSFRFVTEAELQDGVATALCDARIRFEREVTLGPRDRIDFMVGRIGIEVKTDGSLAAVTRQLFRYAQHDRIDDLILVTAMRRHDQLPVRINGRKIAVCTIGRAFQ